VKSGIILLISPFILAFFFQARLPGVARPDSPGGVIFDHIFHVVDNEMACEDCHAGAETSLSGRDNLLPDMDVCSDCHDVDDDDECASCHVNADDPEGSLYITTYSQKFPHQTHLLGGFECEACHASLLVPDAPSAEALPGMVNCQQCHEMESASLECSTCHMPDDVLKPASHTPSFLHTHSDMVQFDTHEAINGLQCQSCHDDDFCSDCHEGDNVDRLTHPLNYEFTHALDARGQERTCITCHSEPTFCVDCHNDNQVLPLNHRPGWVNTVDGGLHRFEASADLNNCIACHQDNADQICQPCHGSFN
jgi:hypothetical protein